MRMKRSIIGGLGIILLASILDAKIARIEINASYFFPSEKAFRDIYGEGIKYGFDISRNVWKNMELHVYLNYLFKRGELTFTRERTWVKIIPLGTSLRYTFLKKKINLYAGVGLTYNLFEEKNPIGRVREDKLGYTAKIGGFKRLKGLKKFMKEFIIDVYINYNYCKMKPAEIKFDIGGVDLGIGFGFEF